MSNFAVGDKVIVHVGPHKGQVHKVINEDNGIFTVVPIVPPASVRYVLGEAQVRADKLSLHEAATRGSPKSLKEAIKTKDPAKLSGTVFADHIRGADEVSRSTKDGTHTFYRGFFYRHGSTSEGHAERISKSLTDAGIEHTVIDHGTQDYKPFRGGASVKSQNHHWVKIKIHPGQKLEIHESKMEYDPEHLLIDGEAMEDLGIKHRLDDKYGPTRKFSTGAGDVHVYHSGHYRGKEIISVRSAGVNNQQHHEIVHRLISSHGAKNLREDRLDEISPSHLSTYVERAARDLSTHAEISGYSSNTEDEKRAHRARAAKRVQGLQRSGRLLAKKATTNETIAEARRGRPPKTAMTGADDSNPHIIMQLRKAVSLGGGKIKYNDGDARHIPAGFAAEVLDHYAQLAPREKEEFQAHIAASHDNAAAFKKFVPSRDQSDRPTTRPLDGARTVKKPRSDIEKKKNLARTIAVANILRTIRSA